MKVKGTMDGLPFQSSFMALGDGNHELPVKAELLRAIGKAPGESIRVNLLERVNPVRKHRRDLERAGRWSSELVRNRMEHMPPRKLSHFAAG